MSLQETLEQSGLVNQENQGNQENQEIHGSQTKLVRKKLTKEDREKNKRVRELKRLVSQLEKANRLHDKAIKYLDKCEELNGKALEYLQKHGQASQPTTLLEAASILTNSDRIEFQIPLTEIGMDQSIRVKKLLGGFKYNKLFGVEIK